MLGAKNRSKVSKVRNDKLLDLILISLVTNVTKSKKFVRMTFDKNHFKYQTMTQLIIDCVFVECHNHPYVMYIKRLIVVRFCIII